ncbi:MAG: hypothetical protein ABGW84_13260 [Sphingomonadaceae bacterium]
MASEHIRMVTEAERQVREFTLAAADVRSVPILTRRAVSIAFDRSGKDAAAARRSLKGIYEKTPPHLLGLPSDEHITGRFPTKQRNFRPNAQARDKGASKRGGGSSLELFIPCSRPRRPISASGYTSFHFSFEAIARNHIEYSLPTKSGRKARPDEHGKYLEDEEKRAVEPVIVPVDPENFAHYQEREQALALAEQECVFSNIEGDRTDRIELFRAAGEMEKSNRPPTLTVDIRTQSEMVTAFISQAWNNEVLSRAMVGMGWDKVRKHLKNQDGDRFVDDLSKVTFSGEDAIAAFDLLHRLGWREHFQNPQEFRSDGIEWDPGKSGRIHMRIVGEIPHELDAAGRRSFLKSIAARFDKLAVPYVLVMHRPTADNHEKNWHFHLIYWDRPAERFGPEKVRERLAAGEAEVARYSKRNSKFIEAALNDPKVQAQAGRFDFEVEYAYIDAKGRERTIFPFRQNKNRECTRSAFVPDLRALVAEISNRELERVGVKRRVSASTYSEMDIPKAPDEHLNDSANRKELAGQSTLEGSANEAKQWDYLLLMLDRQLEQEKKDIGIPWLKLHRQLRDQGVDTARLENVQDEWISLKLVEIKLRDQARRAGELAERMLSRPRMMANDSLNNLEAILNGTASRKVKSKRDFHLKRMALLDEHCSAVAELFRSELGLQARLEKQADDLGQRAVALLEKSGLGRDALFLPLEKAEPAPVTIRASNDATKPAQPAAGRTKIDVNNRRASDKVVSRQLTILADSPVTFAIEEKTGADGEKALIAIIAPQDQAEYGLPKQIVARTPLAMSRLVGIQAAKVKSRTRPTAGNQAIKNPATTGGAGEQLGRQRAGPSDTRPDIAQVSAGVGTLSTDHPSIGIEEKALPRSNTGKASQDIPGSSERTKPDDTRAERSEPIAVPPQDRAKPKPPAPDARQVAAQKEAVLEEEARWLEGFRKSKKTSPALKAKSAAATDGQTVSSARKEISAEDVAGRPTEEAGRNVDRDRTSLEKSTGKAIPEKPAPQADALEATDVNAVGGPDSVPLALSQADRDRMESAPLYLFKTLEGEFLLLGDDVPPSLAAAASSGQHAHQFGRWHERQKDEQREIAKLFSQSPYANSMELEAGVSDGGADLRLAILWARWADSRLWKQAVEQGLEMRRIREREAALEAERKREYNRQVAMAQNLKRGF